MQLNFVRFIDKKLLTSNKKQHILTAENKFCVILYNK